MVVKRNLLEEEESRRFDAKAWRRFWSVAKLYFVSEKWRVACGLLALLATLSISVSLLNVMMSYIGRDFMTALTLREEERFYRELTLYLLAFAVTTPVVVFYRYAEERLGLSWRKWLSLKLIHLYLSHRSYYRINTEGLIDNPDQRLEEDIRTFTTLSLSFLLIIFNSIIALFSFVGILWSISITLTGIAVLYAILGSLFTYVLGRPLIPLNFAQLKREADYRYKLVNIRDHAESIAFYRGEKKEFTRVRQRLNKALDNLRDIIDWNRNLGFFRTGYNFLITVLPTAVVAPLYLRGEIEIGVVTQANLAFGQVLGALSIIVANFNGLSAFAAVVTRLGKFWEVVQSKESSDPLWSIQTEESSTVTSFTGVTILTPVKREMVVKDLNFTFPEISSLLVSGPSGSGKSSILRAMAGLWSGGLGTIVRPPIKESIFLPQRPYMVLGTLRNQLLYGIPTRAVTDEDLEHVVNQVGLSAMMARVGGFSAVLDWSHILSLGEQQRLSLARVLLARPKYVFLDEATTAIDNASERHLYGLVNSITNSIVSVGLPDRLASYHRYILELDGVGGWQVKEISCVV
jgi:putative ATP-binding cassette transporter